MASPMSKQLGDFLQEQQDPFTLEVYLHERGYPRSNSSQFLKESPKKRRKSLLPSCPKIVRAVFTRLAQSEANRKLKNCWNYKNGRAVNGNCEKDLAEDDHFSSASSSTVFNSCSESDAEEDEGCRGSSVLQEKQVFADRKMIFSRVDDRKQLSPVSVLEETESSGDDSSPIHQIEENQEAEKEHKTLDYERTIEEKGVSSQYIRNRNAIEETRQLLFDCVSEVVESQRRSRRKDKGAPQIGRIWDAEQLWKLICENIWVWSQDAIDETNIDQLVRFGLSDSSQEWRSFHGVQAQEIGVIISEIMLEDIRDEIVRDMIISFSSI